MDKKLILSTVIEVSLLSAFLLFSTAQASNDSAANGYNFLYKTNGSNAVLPTQVFDHGDETYFQFNVDKTVPAIFAVSPCGNRILLTTSNKGPYIRVPGMYKQYSLQIGQKTATVEYAGPAEIPLSDEIANETDCKNTVTHASFGATPANHEYGPVAPIHGDSKPPKNIAIAYQPARQGSIDDAKKMVEKAKSEIAGTRPGTATAVASSASGAPLIPQARPLSLAANSDSIGPQSVKIADPTWVTSPTDENLRLLIGRWATSIGWKLVWDVDKDVPIDSKDEMTGDFRAAVRRVLIATEFGDISLKPCFYTNNVIRVVRQTTKCNPSE